MRAYPGFHTQIASMTALQKVPHKWTPAEQVQGHLMKPNVYKFMRLEDMHPRVLREMTDVVAKPLFIMFEKS